MGRPVDCSGWRDPLPPFLMNRRVPWSAGVSSRLSTGSWLVKQHVVRSADLNRLPGRSKVSLYCSCQLRCARDATSEERDHGLGGSCEEPVYVGSKL
jgi:hypothetical protein